MTRIRFAAWIAAAALIGLLCWQARYSTDLGALLPQSDPAAARAIAFYARQGATRILAVEAAPAPGGQAAAQALLAGLPARLAAHGVAPMDDGDPARIAAAARIIAERLPALLTAEELARVPADLAPAALDARLAGLAERAARPDDVFAATAARDDLLALSAAVAQPLLEGLGGSRREGAVMLHADGTHAAIVLQVPFEPTDLGRTEALMADLDAIAATAAAAGIRIEAIGPYRHYRENMAAVGDALGGSMPLALILIMLTLFSLIPDVRALLALHVPAVLGMAGGVAAVALSGMAVPLPLLGAGAAILGVAVDYGQHVVVAARGGELHAATRPLVITFLTTAAAFAVLTTSAVPAIRCMGIMVVGGLGVALLASLTLLPSLLPRLRARDPWLPVSRPLLALSRRRPAVNLAIAGLLTAAAIPGLLRLTTEHDLRRFDGSRPESWRALDAFLARWGSLDASEFIVAEDADLERALDRVQTARDGIGLAPGLVERFLPGPAERGRRAAAWNALWSGPGAGFAGDLAAVAARHRLRAAAFAGSVERYRPVAAAPAIALSDWQGSAIAPLLSGYVQRLPDGRWQVASPVGRKPTAAEAAAWSARLEPAGAWLASREQLGRMLVETVHADLVSRSAAIVAVVLLVVWLVERRLRLVAAVLLPAGLALAWTFGALGWLGIPLSPFAVLAAAFVGGIGVDSAVFLAHRPRAETLSPVLVASLTTIFGMLSLLAADHPMILAMGQLLGIGMTACLLSCLLITPALAAEGDG